MQSLLSYIIGRLKAADHARALRYDKSIHALELVYLGVMRKGKPSVADAISSTRRIVLAHSYLPEVYLIVLGYAILTVSVGVFSQPDVEYGLRLPVVVTIGAIFAGVLPLALAFVTLPFHLLAGASLWLLTGIHVLITAFTFSAIQPSISKLLLDNGSAEFQDLFLPILIFYGLAEFYLLSRLHDALSFPKYQERHRPPSIDNIIPAHKSGALVSMSSQDHYVEIVTENGLHLERLTMKRAVELVPETAGIQVHRSHWVSYSAIVGMEKTGDRHVVLLRNGAKIPVGKSNVEKVAAYLAGR